MSHPKVLLIAHEGSRSGAPILLLTLARWLVANTRLEFEVLLLRNGPLRPEFEALAPTLVLDELSGRAHRVGRVVNRLARLDEVYWTARALRRLVDRRYTVVYGNSIVCLPWLARLKPATGARCVCAVHELTWTISRFMAKAYVKATLPLMDKVVAGSQAVRDNLIATFAIAPASIEVVHSFINEDLTIRRSATELRRELGIEDGCTVIGAVGNAELRKGVDLVAPIVRALAARDPGRRFRFVWLGGAPGNELVSLCQRDAVLLGVDAQVLFADADPDANDYLNLCDVFALPSREDPFPLVVLSAIRLGKPVVAFERSGGMDELLVGGAGRLVPYLDATRFAEAIDDVLRDGEARARMVGIARTKVLANFGVEKLARQIYRTLQPSAAEA